MDGDVWMDYFLPQTFLKRILSIFSMPVAFFCTVTQECLEQRTSRSNPIDIDHYWTLSEPRRSESQQSRRFVRIWPLTETLVEGRSGPPIRTQPALHCPAPGSRLVFGSRTDSLLNKFAGSQCPRRRRRTRRRRTSTMATGSSPTRTSASSSRPPGTRAPALNRLRPEVSQINASPNRSMLIELITSGSAPAFARHGQSGRSGGAAAAGGKTPAHQQKKKTGGNAHHYRVRLTLDALERASVTAHIPCRPGRRRRTS